MTFLRGSRIGDPVHGPGVTGGTHLVFRVLRVDDHAPREIERLTDERKSIGLGFPERRLEPDEGALGTESRIDTAVALDCGQIPLLSPRPSVRPAIRP